MEKSQSIVNLAKALKAFHAGMGKIKKDAKNPFFNSKYASLSTILETIKQPLQDAGLSFTQFPTGQYGLTTVLMHTESGEYMQCDYYMQPIKLDPQALGSVISYARRYALAAVLGLNIDDDDDGNAATHGAATPQQAAAKVPAAAEKPWLDMNSKKYDLVVEKLKNKTTTLGQVAQFFKLNKEVRAELQSIINETAESPAPPFTSSTSQVDLSMWETLLQGCDSLVNLTNIYKSNKTAVDNDASIKGLFTKRRLELEKKSPEHKVA